MQTVMAEMRRRVGAVAYRLAVNVRGESSVFSRLGYLRSAQHWSSEDLARAQREALARLLSESLPQVAYYARWQNPIRRLSADNVTDAIQDLPIIEKDILQRSSDVLLATGYRGRTYRKTTGGSTGKAVTIWKNPEAIAQEMAASWLGYSWFGVEIGDPCVRFWGQPVRNWKRRLRYAAADAAMHRVTISAFGYSRRELKSYMARIARFRPAYLYGYVSALEDLGREILSQGTMPEKGALKCIITTSEVLTPPQRSVIERAFNAPVQNEYGCGEVGPIAYQCTSGSLHVMALNQFVEIIREDGSRAEVGEPGAVLITDLANRAMPLVRYRVGDVAAWGEPCSCGRPFPVLQTVFGREYDFVEAPDGRRYHGEYFMYLFEDLRSRQPGIAQFQMVQDGRDSLLARVVLTTPDVHVLEAVTASLRERCPQFKVRTEAVERLERRPSGKMLVVENRVARSLTG